MQRKTKINRKLKNLVNIETRLGNFSYSKNFEKSEVKPNKVKKLHMTRK